MGELYGEFQRFPAGTQAASPRGADGSGVVPFLPGRHRFPD